MVRTNTFYPAWVLTAGAAWALVWAGLTWRLDVLVWASFVSVDLLVGVGLGLVTIAMAQWLQLRWAGVDANALLWVVGTELGYWTGLPLALVGWFMGVSGGPWPQLVYFLEAISPLPLAWLYAPATVFIATAVSGVVAGPISGFLYERAVRQGRLRGWIVASTCSWGAAIGTIGLMVTVFMYPGYYFLDHNTVERMPIAAGGAIVGGLAGLVHAAVLGLYLSRVAGMSAAAGERSSSPTQHAG